MPAPNQSWSECNISRKPCRSCGVEFQPRSSGNFFCSGCMLVQRRKMDLAGQRRRRDKDPAKHAAMRANSELKSKYGITLDDYNRMHAEQGGRCAICRTKQARLRAGAKRPFAVDHCHRTGKVRALLCNRCNAGLGMVDDNTEVLAAMISYVLAHRVGNSDT